MIVAPEETLPRRPRRRPRGRARRLAVGALACALGLGGGCSHLVPHSNAGIAFLEETAGPVGALATGAKYLGWIAGAPLVIALSPLAALAWATPWVDLPAAVDLATAPSIGLGYAVEAGVGFPLYGALFWSEREARERSGPLQAPRTPRTPWGFVVDHREAAPSPGSPAPVPEGVRDYYRVPPACVARIASRLVADRAPGSEPRARSDDDPARVRFEGALPSTLEVHWSEAAARGPRPLLLVTPPTRSVFAARYVARRYAERGVHAAVLVPDAVFLEPEKDPAAVEAKLRRAVVIARAALAALGARPDVDAERLLYFGVSAGGIFGAVLLGVEPAIDRAVLVFPGGDLPRIVRTSDERSVTAYREAWAERGVPPDELARRLDAAVRTDPLRVARHVAPERVLLFLGAWDSKVPVQTGLALRRRLGRPETWLLAGNHATAGLCFGFVLREADRFLLGG